MTQPTLLGRYTILRELGRDATGTVYAARDQGNGAMVALQTLDPALRGAADPGLTDAFLNNARSAMRLRHANIVRVHDAGEAGGTAYVAAELVEGESLRQVLDQRPLPVARAIQIFADIAAALAYAHEEGAVHRGVRPSNIVVLPSGVARIGDFGIGQIGEAALPYMSPEQVRGDPVDQRSDLFSLGAVLYEMLTRRAPFEGDSPQEIRDAILQAEPLPPSEVNPLVPGALDRMVLGMLARRPEDRAANARLLLRDLQRLEEGLGLRFGSSTPAPKQPRERIEPRHEVPPFARREPAFDEPDERVMRHRALQAQRRPRSRSGAWTALALTLGVASIGLTVFLNYPPRIETPKQIATPPAPAIEAPKPITPAPVAAAPVAAAPEPPPPLPAPAVAEVKMEQPRVTPAPEKKPAPAIPKAQPAATARLTVAVSPQGELYIDGKHYGTTPPTTTFDLEPGMHRIEIRSGARRPYLTYMTVEPGDERRIQHDFNAKPMRPPV